MSGLGAAAGPPRSHQRAVTAAAVAGSAADEGTEQQSEQVPVTAHERRRQRQQRQQAQQPAAEHEAAMELAFSRSQAKAHAQWDLWAGVSLTVLLPLALPSSLQRKHWRAQLAAFVAEVGMRVAPAYFACLTRDWYLARRTHIVTACRLASALLPRLVVQPPPPSSSAWGGWAQFLLFTRALGVNTLPWLARLPFKYFAWVHLVAVIDAARSSVAVVCASPAFTSSAAQTSFAGAARAARILAMLAPMPNHQAPDGGSCLDGKIGSNPDGGACACRQMAVWVLACIGYALPLACQYVAEVAARRRFFRRHCLRPHCVSCASGKGVDLVTLIATVVILFLAFSAVCWQLAGSIFVPAAMVADQAAALPVSY